HHPGGIDFLNNTAFSNPRNFDLLADQGPAEHFLRNNLTFGTGSAIANAGPDIDAAFNSWNGGVNLSNADFLNVSSTGADGPRQADGSLPLLNFMHLAPGSDLIDAGVNVGLPFNGSAPDLGAFESVPEPHAISLLCLLAAIGSRRTRFA